MVVLTATRQKFEPKYIAYRGPAVHPIRLDDGFHAGGPLVAGIRKRASSAHGTLKRVHRSCLRHVELAMVLR